jgi:hypothetical protein
MSLDFVEVLRAWLRISPAVSSTHGREYWNCGDGLGK